ncbi:MAG: peptide/nickel transport system permease protein [Chloroflexia bacterium]|jgi:peptide/nickel transport system permease protein|nr:peptide/nickel transport system permease protein [Chloroflexia bacterium]
MVVYLIRRFMQGLLILALSNFLIYTILVASPGGPLDQFAELQHGRKDLNAERIKKTMEAYKLDSPYPLSYLRWLFDPSDYTELNGRNESVQKGVDIWVGDWHVRGSGLLTGNFGRSLVIARGLPVTEMIGNRVGNTLALTVSALLLALLIAFPIGIISAIRQYSRLDYAVTALSFVGLSMPTFWMGLMLIIFLAVLPKQLNLEGATWLPYLPPGGLADIDRGNDVLNRLYHLVLPVTVLATVQVAQFSRFIRGSMLEVLRQDYVRTAWAKGLSQRMVILRHALRNAMLPVITIITLTLPALFSSAIGTETVFGYSGMGLLFVTSVFAVDLPLVMFFLLIITTLIILSNILADVLFALVDPRIRFS